MAHDVIGNILFDEKVVDPMGCDGTVEGVVDGTLLNIGAIH